ncbi:MAG: hypothetical protein JWN86_1840 [Planctomycetota bacterium]|nr:hypothetical protein [Planctomycetota bacterium]
MNDNPSATVPENEALIDPLVLLARHAGALIERPSWSLGVQRRLLACVERAVVNRCVLRDHLRALRAGRVVSFEFSSTLSPERLSALRDEGLGSLDDTSLIALARDPVALELLAEAVQNDEPEAWRAVQARDGAMLYEEQGRPVPRLADVLSGPARPRRPRS